MLKIDITKINLSKISKKYIFLYNFLVTDFLNQSSSSISALRFL